MKRIYKVIFVLMFAFLFVGLSQAKADSAVTAIDGASIRVKTETSAQGLRFYAELGESVKGNEHGFYLAYGKATVVDLENALLEAGSGVASVNDKPVFRVTVPGVSAENRFSVVLTGIPEVGYFDEISVIPFVVQGANEVFVNEPVKRSVAAVVLNMATNGQDVSKVEALESITKTDKKKVGLNADGDLEVSSGVLELNHFNLREIFIADWNAKFKTDWVKLEAAEFWASAKVGLSDEKAANKDLTASNIYKFFKDDVYGPKWKWLLDYMEVEGAGNVHAARQAVALNGNGTNAEQQLWHADHLSYSIANFFNQKDETSGSPAVSFVDGSRYERIADHNKSFYVDLNKYEFYDVGQSLVVPVAPAERAGYNFDGYKAGATNLNPGALHVIGDDVVLKPVFVAINYTIKFYDGDDELSALAANYNIESNVTLPKPSVEGKAFRGWYDNKQFSGDPIAKIDAGSMGNKVFYAQFSDGNMVSYDLGEYGYHTSEKTKEDLLVDFIEDYKTLFGRTATDVEGFMKAFFAASYLPAPHKIEDIFTHENGKHKWLQDHILSVATKSGYEKATDLLENDQATWRANIQAFIEESLVTEGGVTSLDFTMEQNAHNFWQHTDYGKYEGDFVAGGALFNGVKTDSKIYGFVGWVDEGGNAVTQLPATAGDYKYLAKWERSAFYVRFNIGYDAPSPDTQLVPKNDKVVKPADPVRTTHDFAGWYKDAGFAAAYDFNAGVTEEMTIYAKWTEKAAGAEYNINYVLDGGKIVYGTKAEMINAFLEDFYAYLKLEIPMSDFKHGTGNSSGFDGLWHSAHKAKIYGGPRPTEVNEAYFISSADYMDKWLPFFDMLHEFMLVVNETQLFFDAGPSTGLIRIRQYIIDVKPAHYVTEETMNMMPEPLIEAPAVTKGKVGIELTLQAAYKADKIFDGWYTNPEFTGEAVTKLNPESAGDVTLYAKFR